MLKPENLQIIYSNFPRDASDYDTLKWAELDQPNCDYLTTLMLIEAERFWAAALLQLLGVRELSRVWLQTWSEVTLYYADFFAMNSILRLSGRAITFSERHNNQVYCIRRTSTQARNYKIVAGGKTDHKAQWNLYYDLIQNKSITDDTTLRLIFDHQLEFRHEESETRQVLNYNLMVGYDERHYASEALKERSEFAISLFPFEEPIVALEDDFFVDEAKVICIWLYLKSLFSSIARVTNYQCYWQTQTKKLLKLVQEMPIDDGIKGWVTCQLSEQT